MLFSQDFVCFLRFFALSKKDKNITFERIRNKDAKCSFKRKKKRNIPNISDRILRSSTKLNQTNLKVIPATNKPSII